MARTPLPVNTLVPNGALADPTGVLLTVGAGNGLQVAANNAYFPQVFLRVANASGGTSVVSVLAGSQPSAPSSGQGAATASVATGATSWVGPFETARVMQPDGSLIIEATAAVTITAFGFDPRRI